MLIPSEKDGGGSGEWMLHFQGNSPASSGTFSAKTTINFDSFKELHFLVTFGDIQDKSLYKGWSSDDFSITKEEILNHFNAGNGTLILTRAYWWNSTTAYSIAIIMRKSSNNLQVDWSKYHRINNTYMTDAFMKMYYRN